MCSGEEGGVEEEVGSGEEGGVGEEVGRKTTDTHSYSTHQVEPSDGCCRRFLVDSVVFAGKQFLVQGSQGHLPV